MDNKQRNSGIELLRIITMLGVIILHYNSISSGRAFEYVNQGSINQVYLFWIESLFICAVNLFVLISAFFLCTTNKRSPYKIFEFILQLVLIRLLYYFLSLLMGAQFHVSELITAALPANYYVILYSALYIISPYINILIDHLDIKHFQRFLIIIFALFSVWSFGVDLLSPLENINSMSTIGLYGSQRGYTIVNFILIYCIGAYIKKSGFRLSKICATSGMIICSLLLTVFAFMNQNAWNYNNPLVILLTVFVFLLFKEIRFQNSMVNELAKASYTCFIIHGYFMSRMGIVKFANRQLIVLILHQMLVAIGLYIISYIVYFGYSLTLKKFLVRYIKPCFKE